MEETNLGKYTIEWGEEADPVIVLTGTLEEFDTFCTITHRTKKNAIRISAGYQIPFYPHLPIIHYGSFWLNGAYNSPEYTYRITELMEAEVK
jgi:hypothetical protein